MEVLNPKGVAAPLKPYYSNGVIVGAGPLMFIAGQVPIDADGKSVGAGDVRTQTVQVLENIQSMLRASNADMSDVVSVNVYVTDIGSLESIADIRLKYFPESGPASTIVEVARLAKPEFLIEISAVASVPPVEEKVFLNYTQAELDRNFDQRAWCARADEFVQRYRELSKTLRAKSPPQMLRYGAAPDEMLDVFTAPKGDGTAVLFVHAGGWRNFNSDDFSFVARGFLDAGISCVVVNMSKLPHVRLPDVLAQLKAAYSWVVQNAAQLGIDESKLYLIGHSSGAHLAALLSLSDRGAWRGLPRGCTFLSGTFDLIPALRSARGSYIHVRPDEIRGLSPIHLVGPHAPTTLVAFVENDSDEFKRQSIEFAQRMSAVERLAECLCLPESSHFKIVEDLGDKNSQLFLKVLAHLRASIARKR